MRIRKRKLKPNFMQRAFTNKAKMEIMIAQGKTVDEIAIAIPDISKKWIRKCIIVYQKRKSENK